MLSKREHQLAYTAIKTVWLHKRVSSDVLFRLAKRSASAEKPLLHFTALCQSGEEQLRERHSLKGRLPGHLLNWHSEKSTARGAFTKGSDPRNHRSFWRWCSKSRKKLHKSPDIKNYWNRWLDRLNNGEPELPGLREGIEQMRNAYQQRTIVNDYQQTPAANRRESATSQHQRASAKAPLYRKS